MKNWSRILGSAILLSACSGAEEAAISQTSQALSLEDVLGFETLSNWTVSSGTKTALSDATQGSTALGVSGFHYTQISSAAAGPVGQVSSTLALDVKIPQGMTWGDLRLILRAPSVGLWYQDLGAVQLSSITPGSYQTLTFAVPAGVVSALSSSPSDLSFAIQISGPFSAQPFQFDNLRFGGGSTGPTKVEMRVPAADDFIYLELNGVRRRIAYWGQSEAELNEWRDVTSWFVGGNNTLRLQGMNGGGPMALDFQLRVNGTNVVNVTCPSVECPNIDYGWFIDKTITIPALNLPPARTVNVSSPVSGKLYINDVFTGLSTPTTLTLPAGQYKLGLGVSTDAPNNLSGSFYEETLVVGSSDLNFTLGDEAALPAAHPAKVAIIPVRRAHVASNGGTAVLSDAQIAKFKSQVEATRDTWVKPFSYGLETWDITLLPTEEELEINSPDYDSFPDHACQFLSLPKYASIYNQYDVFMMHFSNYDEAQGFTIGRGDAGMGGKCGQVQAHWGANLASNAPIPVILHEMLHRYEGQQWQHHHLTNGIDGLHGAPQHGFHSTGTQGEPEWVEWYRYFMRGQVPEVSSQLSEVPRSTPVSPADFYVGAFSVIRYGMASSLQ